ncbi:13055_t:CDS:2 [Acaulospora colombiana]|uniref:13055_t:CDS:1 n=1 Tax=Acaulospora colombiana TaxID=27376 RepID=A0ACA9QWN0_9GLOM|nr:13055_t:CDS:2 [Acaulospora colombiana]
MSVKGKATCFVALLTLVALGKQILSLVLSLPSSLYTTPRTPSLLQATLPENAFGALEARFGQPTRPRTHAHAED